MTDDNAAERLEVTEWESDLCEILVGIVFRLGFCERGAGANMLTVPYGILGTGGGGEGARL